MFDKVQSRTRSRRSHCNAFSIRLRSVLCSCRLALLFVSCVFISIVAGQHGNSASPGTWVNAILSVARCSLAATSLPIDGLAMFAGGLMEPNIFSASYVFISVIAIG